MKSLFRAIAADVLWHTRITALARRAARSNLVILGYHRVLPEAQRSAYIVPELAVTPRTFETHVALAARHYRCLPLRDALKAQTTAPSDRPLLVFTFDDGYADNAIAAAPILEKHGIRATFFVVSALIGSAQRAWYDLLGRLVQRSAVQPIPALSHKPEDDDPAAVWIAEHFRHRHGVFLARTLASAKALPHDLRREIMSRLHAAAPPDLLADESDRMMTPDQVAALAARGHEIASHSATHPLLPQLSDEELDRELRDSRAALETLAGREITSLAYPNGDHDDRVVAAARAAGYRGAVTMLPGLNAPGGDPFRLRRVYANQDRFASRRDPCRASLFELELSGLADRLFLRRFRSESFA